MKSAGATGDAPAPSPSVRTLEKQAARLREANEHLVLAAIDAQVLRDTAARLNRRQELFLATLAHELRNPLAPIRTANAILGHIAVDEPRLQHVYEIIERQVKHMARLLDDLLDIARMTSGKMKLRRRTITVREFLDQAVETSRPLIDERQQSLAIEIPPQPIYVDGDAVRLAQAFGNLLHNASKYTHIGGNIALTAALAGDSVQIRVTDNGVGMTQESVPGIFELFAQTGHLDETAQGGLGIGLTVVRSMVEMHGGTVVASSPGEGLGSEFLVTLPIQQPDAHAGEPDSETVGRVSRREVIGYC